MSVTVVIPTRNRPEMLLKAIASLPADHKVVVVDDASDVPVTVTDPRVRVLRRELAGGAGAARNIGIQAATTEWVAFCDDDDEWLPGRTLPHGAEVVVYGSESSPRHRRFDADTVLDGYTPSCNAVAVRRDLCPTFDESFRALEDVDWWLRLAQTARLTFVDTPGYRVGVHDGTRHGAGQDARIRYSQQLLERHSGWFAAHPRARSFRLARMGQMIAREQGRFQALPHLLEAVRTAPSAVALKSAAAALRG